MELNITSCSLIYIDFFNRTAVGLNMVISLGAHVKNREKNVSNSKGAIGTLDLNITSCSLIHIDLLNITSLRLNMVISLRTHVKNREKIGQ